LNTSSLSIDALRQGARGGEPQAQLALGEALLRAGTSLSDYREAETAIRAAHVGGEAEATARLAMLAAMGVTAPADWREALALLALAASRGSSAAQGQLRALAAHAVQAAGEQDWAALAAAVDLAAWTRVPAKQVLSVTPRVATIAGFLPGPVCDWIVARAGDRITPAQVFDQETGAPVQADARSNSAVEFNFADVDVVLALVRAAIAAAIDVPLTGLEPTQVLHYEVGQAFAPHYDFMDPLVPGYALEAQRGGQRVATFLVYLNEAFEGGETDFPLLQLRAKAPPGGALYFANVDAGGAPDRRTLHAGLAPTSGEKWLLSQWVRMRPGR
jgi:prolyl 4-hydroxylase